MKDANHDVLDRGSLAQLLRQRARHTSDRRLAIDAALGVTAAAALAVLRPPFWLPLVALALSLGSFGLWGIVDRELSDAEDQTRRARVLVFVRGLVGVFGAAVAALFGVTAFFGLLGTWIS
jgi:hypothetical protein